MSMSELVEKINTTADGGEKDTQDVAMELGKKVIAGIIINKGWAHARGAVIYAFLNGLKRLENLFPTAILMYREAILRGARPKVNDIMETPNKELPNLVAAIKEQYEAHTPLEVIEARLFNTATDMCKDSGVEVGIHTLDFFLEGYAHMLMGLDMEKEKCQIPV